MTISTPAGPQRNAAQIAHWNSDVGDRWAALQERIDGVFAPITTALLSKVTLRPGSNVLDVGCGSGATTLALAKAVGPAGRVCGVDVSKPILAVAERRVEAERLDNVDLLLADASTHRFGLRSFDQLVSRFGVMFFDDPIAAFANLRRTMMNGGRLAFACWQAMPASSWFEVPAAAVRPMLPSALPSDPSAPGPFAFADPDRVRGILVAAGLGDITIEPQVVSLTLGDAAAATALVTQIGPTSRLLAEAEPHRTPALIEALRAALTTYERPDGVVLEGAIWLVSCGSKSTP